MGRRVVILWVLVALSGVANGAGKVRARTWLKDHVDSILKGIDPRSSYHGDLTWEVLHKTRKNKRLSILLNDSNLLHFADQSKESPGAKELPVHLVRAERLSRGLFSPFGRHIAEAKRLKLALEVPDPEKAGRNKLVDFENGKQIASDNAISGAVDWVFGPTVDKWLRLGSFQAQDNDIRFVKDVKEEDLQSFLEELKHLSPFQEIPSALKGLIRTFQKKD